MENGLKKIAAILGIVQGLTWVILSIICISLYLEKTKTFTPAEHFIQSVGYEMYYFYLDSNESFIPFRHVMSSHVFTGFMWIYLILDLIWLTASICTLTTKKQRSQEIALKAWAHCTLTISLWDLITVAILAADYDKCLNFSLVEVGDAVISNEIFCANVILPVLMIAAKGFVLWIVNITIAIVLIKIAKRLKQTPAVHNLQQPSPFQPHHTMPLDYQPKEYSERFQPSAPSNLHRDSYGRQYVPKHNNQYGGPTNRNLPRDDYGQQQFPSTPPTNQNRFEYPVQIPPPDYHPNQKAPSPNRRQYY